jgi:hypothetical protein
MNDNPRAVMGDNIAPDYAQEVTARMAADYAELTRSADAVLNEARELPKEVADDNAMGVFARVIIRLRDLSTRATALHKKEKEPYLRGGEAVDQFFFGLVDKLARRQRTNKPGAADILQARIDSYVQAKAAEERRRREEEARRAAEAERRAAKERLDADNARAVAEEAARRSRKAANIEAHEEEARRLAAEAAQKAQEQEAARSASQDARAAAAAPTADLIRSRTEEGHLVTAKREPFVEIIDEMQLDAAALWPFVKSDHKLQALKAWAKVTQHRQSMAGAIIELRDRAVIR